MCRGIFITGSSLLGAAIRVPRITSKNLIRYLAYPLLTGRNSQEGVGDMCDVLPCCVE